MLIQSATVWRVDGIGRLWTSCFQLLEWFTPLGVALRKLLHRRSIAERLAMSARRVKAGTRFRQGKFGDISYIAGSLIPEPLGLGKKSTGDRNRTCTGYPT